MSYDLMVFEPEAAPKEHQAFMQWYVGFTKWNEGHSYGDPKVTSQRLRSWLVEMQRTYPDMNSLEAADLLSADDGSLSDYSIGKQAIYAGFAWSRAEQVYEHACDLAAKHGVGFFDVSSEGEGSLDAGQWNSKAGSSEGPARTLESFGQVLQQEVTIEEARRRLKPKFMASGNVGLKPDLPKKYSQQHYRKG